MASLLEIRQLSVGFPTEAGTVQAVDQISVSLTPAETLAIVGESGSGKSVTALAVMGLLPSTAQISGEIWYAPPEAQPVNLLTLPPEMRRTYRGGAIAMIFQEPMTSLNPVMTCGQQVVEAILLHQQVTREVAQQQAIDLFREVKLPDPETLMHRYPHQLSGGQIQRVMIAMALSGNPELLIADEPTTSLDVTIQSTILQLLAEIRDRRHMAILFITHDMGVVSEIADRVAVMYRGCIVETASVYELFSLPQHPYTKGLLSCRPQPQHQLKRLPTIAEFMEITTDQQGKLQIIPLPESQMQHNPRFATTNDIEKSMRIWHLSKQEPILVVQNLTKVFPVRRGWFQSQGVIKAVDQVSFEVYPGETLGLVGESGCGKSTLSRVLLRLIEPTSGQVVFDGKSVLQMNATQLRQLRREMQIVFQNPFGSLNPRQTIGSALIEPMVIHNPGQSQTVRRDHAIAILQRVGLDASAMNRYPHEFSGGQRQRICIARVLACRPRFIVCDESVSALDVSVQAQVLNLLKDLQEQFGLTYIFISHDLNVVKFISDRILVMNQGKVEEIGPAEQIYRHPSRDYTRQLIEAIPRADLAEIRDRQAARQAVLGSLKGLNRSAEEGLSLKE
jgi:peptide/nickel transport system ATP-binding protein